MQRFHTKRLFSDFSYQNSRWRWHMSCHTGINFSVSWTTASPTSSVHKRVSIIDINSCLSYGLSHTSYLLSFLVPKTLSLPFGFEFSIRSEARQHRQDETRTVIEGDNNLCELLDEETSFKFLPSRFKHDVTCCVLEHTPSWYIYELPA